MYLEHERKESKIFVKEMIKNICWLLGKKELSFDLAVNADAPF